MKKLIYTFLTIAAFQTACSFHPDRTEEDITLIDVAATYEENNPVKPEDLMTTEIEYVPLETRDSFLIGKNPRFFLTKDYILSVADKQLFLFDRKSGRFIRQIGRTGQGPEEYTRTDNMCPVNEENQTVSVFADKGKRVYSFDGKVVDNLLVPPLTYETAELSSSLYAGFVPNFSGKEKNKVVLFDKKAVLTKAFPNSFSTLPPEGIHFWKPNGWFYKYKEEVYFYELFNDTIFQVTPDSLRPRFKLHQGRYLPPYEQQNRNDFAAENYFMMKSLSESSRFLFYTFAFQKNRYVLVYDKKKNQSFITKYDDETGGAIPTPGFIPFSLSSVNTSDELVGFWDAYDLARRFSLHPDKTAALPVALRNLQSIGEMENPVVVIGKLKK